MSELADYVDRDPELGGDEKETTITMYGQDKRFSVFSAKPTVVKSQRGKAEAHPLRGGRKPTIAHRTTAIPVCQPHRYR